uniref:Cytochrome c oxidase subunit 3 n=1 Tax=Salix viminalis TaxID=40686 RepID=A0A6N2K4C8_SALVM
MVLFCSSYRRLCSFLLFLGFFSFFFGAYGRDRGICPKRDWGFRSLGILFLIPYSPFIRSCRNLGSSCYTRGKEKRAVYALAATVLLALVFTGFQGMEYYQAPSLFRIVFMVLPFLSNWLSWFSCDYRYSFLIICGIRQYLGHLTKEHHVGFEAAAWYWHFVDVVWLFLFVSIYWWGLEDKENRAFPKNYCSFAAPLIIIYKKVSSTFLPNLSLFWHINEGIEEIMADYVHQEMTRNWILVY